MENGIGKEDGRKYIIGGKEGNHNKEGKKEGKKWKKGDNRQMDD